MDNSEDILFNTEGSYWRGRVELGYRATGWGLALGFEHSRLRLDGVGPVQTDAGPLRLGETDRRQSTMSLALRTEL